MSMQTKRETEALMTLPAKGTICYGAVVIAQQLFFTFIMKVIRRWGIGE